MGSGAQIHNEIAHFLLQISLDIVHHEVLDGVVAFDVRPARLDGAVGSRVEGLEVGLELVHLLADIDLLHDASKDTSKKGRGR